TIELLENPAFRGKMVKKRRHSEFPDAPASLNWHHVYEGGLLDHTYAVTSLSIKVAEVLKKTYKIKINTDVLISGCLLHDIAKLFEYIKDDEEWEGSDVMLDHTMLATSELYARGFPEEVIHMVASHFGDKGPTPPMTLESMILSRMDLFDAEMEASLSDSGNDVLLADIIKDIKN
ncbi:MAG: HDIG domain-containing protein, partial [Candidatus Micrarchaeota archaeon]|nr:HDIG domain-containing protein [Candidatus Micrarchaeota archaeon]